MNANRPIPVQLGDPTPAPDDYRPGDVVEVTRRDPGADSSGRVDQRTAHFVWVSFAGRASVPIPPDRVTLIERDGRRPGHDSAGDDAFYAPEAPLEGVVYDAGIDYTPPPRWWTWGAAILTVAVFALALVVAARIAGPAGLAAVAAVGVGVFYARESERAHAVSAWQAGIDDARTAYLFFTVAGVIAYGAGRWAA